jgi:hypothetical protein
MRPKTRFFFTNLSGFPRFLTRQPMIGGRERPEQAVAQKKAFTRCRPDARSVIARTKGVEKVAKAGLTSPWRTV